MLEGIIAAIGGVSVIYQIIGIAIACAAVFWTIMVKPPARLDNQEDKPKDKMNWKKPFGIIGSIACLTTWVYFGDFRMAMWPLLALIFGYGGMLLMTAEGITWFRCLVAFLALLLVVINWDGDLDDLNFFGNKGIEEVFVHGIKAEKVTEENLAIQIEIGDKRYFNSDGVPFWLDEPYNGKLCFWNYPDTEDGKRRLREDFGYINRSDLRKARMSDPKPDKILQILGWRSGTPCPT